MPIRINLLAEEHALEELRRKDPVRRALGVAILVVLAVLVWSSSLWVKALVLKSDVSGLQARLASQTNEYHTVTNKVTRLKEVENKLTALRQFQVNRFLNGNLLNALQHATVPNVRLVRTRVTQDYSLTPETKATTSDGKKIPAKPATITEKIVVTLDAKDSSPGRDSYTKFKERIAASPYFQQVLGKNQVVLKDLKPPQDDPGAPGRRFVPFQLECQYPEKTR